MVDLLLAPQGSTDLDDALGRVRSATRLAPFDQTPVRFVADLAARLLADPETRTLPDLMAFAYWMRKARVASLQAGFARDVAENAAACRGVVLHYAPSNVDTIFAYSWLLSVLAGNANIVRVSRRRDRTAAALLNQLGALLDEPSYRAIRERTVVASFDRDPEVNRALSAACDLRVIWGGDETIRAIREAPLPPWATDLVFPDRFSLAAFSSEALLAMDTVAWERLIQDFANDVFTYGQMACSSPRLIAWVGAKEARLSARRRFWESFLPAIDKRDPAEWTQPVSSRLTAACRVALQAATIAADVKLDTPVTTVEVSRMTPELRDVHPGGGFFFEADYDTLAGLAADVHAKDQTLVCHGFSKAELAAFAASLPYGGADRIVPVGSALQFSHIWDGQDLLHAFTRRIVLPG